MILPFWEGAEAAADFGHLKLEAVLRDFKGKNGEAILLYSEKGERVLLLGLGKGSQVTPETLRRAYASAIRMGQSKKPKSLNVLFPKIKSLSKEETLTGVAEGIFLTNYAFTQLKHDSLKENPIVLLEQVNWIGLDAKEKGSLEKLKTIAQGVYFIRDLVNMNSDDKTPKRLTEIALSLQKENPKLKTRILDRKGLEEEKMGLILAVNRASAHDPYLILMSYHGDSKSKEHIVLVGKGITYDTGGLRLKTPENMMTMKSDMAGAATVLSAVHTAAALGLKVNVTAVTPVTENCIGPKSYKLGDVYRAYSGKTIEVNDTDAEGRLVLADAIAYAIDHLKPTCLVDLATLTGSIIFGLGEEISGFFTNDEKIGKDFSAASEKTGELIWRMPLHADYKEALKSDIADSLNSGGREGGSIKAALFLQEFVGSVPWAHLDMAGPPFVAKPKHYNTTKATGYGLRLLIHFLEGRSK